MGVRQSTPCNLPAISKNQWQQIPLPLQVRWKVAHGRYRLHENTLTSQRIEQYQLIFYSEEEYEQYLEFFAWRQREEHIVNTKYFQRRQQEVPLVLCGSCSNERIIAWVYLSHTPHRLSSITDIPIPENLYVLSSALSGFQKLYNLVGYFRPSEDMIGIDSDGRVKVWLSGDYSTNYLHGPYYVEPAGLHERSEESMVRRIVGMIEENTSYEGERIGEKFGQFMDGMGKSKLTFRYAQKIIDAYSKKYNLIVPKYFVSLLGLQYYSQDSQYSLSHPATEDPFKVSQSHIRKQQSNLVYYIDPALDSSQGVSSQHTQHANQPQQQLNYQNLMEKYEEEVEGQNKGEIQGDTTTGETAMKGSEQYNHSLSTALRDRRVMPKINFKYSNSRCKQQDQFMTPQHSFINNLHHSAVTPHFTLPQQSLPLSLISQHKTFAENIASSKRLTFSDKHAQHYLDEELAEDMAKYLK